MNQCWQDLGIQRQVCFMPSISHQLIRTTSWIQRPALHKQMLLCSLLLPRPSRFFCTSLWILLSFLITFSVLIFPPLTLVYQFGLLLKKCSTDQVAYKQQKFISHSSGHWKPKIKVAAWLGSGEGPLLGCRRLSFPCIFTWQKRRTLVSSDLYKGTNPIHQASTLMT